MGFTKNVVAIHFFLILAFLVMWWSGLLEDLGMEPLEFVNTLLTLVPAWAWAILILFVAGGIAIERLFGGV